MTDMTEITERIRAERDELPTSNVDSGLQHVRRIVRRRRRQSVLIGVAATAGLVVVGVGAVGLTTTDKRDTVVTDTAPDMTDDVETPTSSPTVPSPQTTLPPSDGDPVDDAPTGASLADTLITTSLDADPDEVTDQLRSVAGEEFFTEWQVPWNGGFLLGGYAGDGTTQTYFSPDGKRWEATTFAMDVDWWAAGGTVVAGDRLVMTGYRQDGPNAIPAVASSTDLSTWVVDDIPTELPPPDVPTGVIPITAPQTVAANADGWIATVVKMVNFDAVALLTEITGVVANGYSSAWSDEGVLIAIDPDGNGESADEIFLSWDDIEAEIGAEWVGALNEGESTEIWVGSWDGRPPVQVSGPADPTVIAGYQPPVAVDGGFVLALTPQDSSDGTRPFASVELVTTTHGDGWSPLEPPFDSAVTGAFPLGGNLGVVAKANDGVISVYRVDVATETWTPLHIPALPTAPRFVTPSGSPALTIDAARSRDLLSATTSTFEQDGLRLTWAYEAFVSSYEVTSLETGDTVVAESIDLRDVEGSLELAFEHLTGGVTMAVSITDPVNGEVLMEIPLGQVEAATPLHPYVDESPQPWVAATTDGDSWFVYELPPADPNQEIFFAGDATVSGERLLFRTEAREFFVVDLT